MKGYTDEHCERDRKIRNDGRMQDEARTAARIRMEIHEAQKSEHETWDGKRLDGTPERDVPVDVLKELLKTTLVMADVLRDLFEQVESPPAQDALKAADLSIDTDNAKTILNTFKGD